MMAVAILAVSCKKEPQTVAVTGVKVTPAAVSIAPHFQHTFTVEVYPADATNKAVTWDYDDSVVEMVEGKENTFIVPFYQDEPIVLTVTTVDGGFTDEAVISVAYPVNPTGITLSDPVAMKVGDTQKLTYTITPADACQCDEEVIWSYEPYVTLDDPTCVITMNEGTGEITAVRPGTATVTVETAIGGKTATKTITISYDNQLTIEGADTITGTSGNVIGRFNSTTVNPTWTIVNGNNFATIDNRGNITIISSGTIEVEAEYVRNNNTYTAVKQIALVYDAGTTTETTVDENGIKQYPLDRTTRYYVETNGCAIRIYSFSCWLVP